MLVLRNRLCAHAAQDVQHAHPVAQRRSITQIKGDAARYHVRITIIIGISGLPIRIRFRFIGDRLRDWNSNGVIGKGVTGWCSPYIWSAFTTSEDDLIEGKICCSLVSTNR